MTFIMNRAVVTGSYAPSMALGRKLDAYDRRRRALLDELDALDPILLSFRHRAGEWTILEILEHLALAERAALLYLTEPSRKKARDGTFAGRFATTLVTISLVFRVPAEPQGDMSLLEVRRLWDENLRWLRALRPMTAAPAVRAAQLHLAAHRAQIWQILERPPVWEP